MEAEPTQGKSHNERQVIRMFQFAGATSPEAAISLSELGLEESWVTNRLGYQEVLHRTDAGLYWVDLSQWNRVQRKGRRQVSWIDILVLLLALALLLAWFLRPRS